MVDRRCKYKLREKSEVYLFIKDRTSHIYYAKFPNLNKVKSTGKTEFRDAYRQAYDILKRLTFHPEPFVEHLLNYTSDKKRKRDLKRILSFLPDVKDYNQVTDNRIKKLQNDLLATGLSGKSVNNYVGLLKSALKGVIDFNYVPIKHVAVYRQCFPVKSFYGFYSKCNSRLHYLAFFAMTTGCRAGEISTVEDLHNGYLKINGTKTKNAVRTIPVLPETLACLEYLKNGFRASSYKQSVIDAAELCGFDTNYIEENNIVFHSFRKMYKTLLESCSIPNVWIEYYMGHSQTSNVNQLYFIGASADDSEVYPKVIEALRRFV